MTERAAQETGPQRMTVSVEEAAVIIGISRGSAYEGVRKKEIPSIQIGRRVLVSLAPLRRLLGETAGVSIEDGPKPPPISKIPLSGRQRKAHGQ